MMKIYLPLNGGLRIAPDADAASVPPEALWIDLFDPSPEERQAVNNTLGVDLPTRADMEEIEVSSRLYAENGALYMTGLVLANSGTETPVAGVVTFSPSRATRPAAISFSASRREQMPARAISLAMRSPA